MNKSTINGRNHHPNPRGFYSEVRCAHRSHGSPYTMTTSEAHLRSGSRNFIDSYFSGDKSIRNLTTIPEYFQNILYKVGGVNCEFRKLEERFTSKLIKPFHSEVRKPTCSNELVYLHLAAKSLLKLIANLKRDLISQDYCFSGEHRESISMTYILINKLEIKVFNLIEKVEKLKNHSSYDFHNFKYKRNNTNKQEYRVRSENLHHKQLIDPQKSILKSPSNECSHECHNTLNTCSPQNNKSKKIHSVIHLTNLYSRDICKSNKTDRQTRPQSVCYQSHSKKANETKKQLNCHRGNSKLIKDIRHSNSFQYPECYETRSFDLNLIHKNNHEVIVSFCDPKNHCIMSGKNGLFRPRRGISSVGCTNHSFDENSLKSRRRRNRAGKDRVMKSKTKSNDFRIKNKNKTNKNENYSKSNRDKAKRKTRSKHRRRRSSLENSTNTSMYEDTSLSQGPSTFTIETEEGSNTKLYTEKSGSPRHKKLSKSNRKKSSPASNNRSYDSSFNSSSYFGIYKSKPKSKRKHMKPRKRSRPVRKHPSPSNTYSDNQSFNSSSNYVIHKNRPKSKRKHMKHRKRSRPVVKHPSPFNTYSDNQSKSKYKKSLRKKRHQVIVRQRNPSVRRWKSVYSMNHMRIKKIPPRKCYSYCYNQDYCRVGIKDCNEAGVQQTCCSTNCTYPCNYISYCDTGYTRHIPYPMCSCSCIQKPLIPRPCRTIETLLQRKQAVKRLRKPQTKVRFTTIEKKISSIHDYENLTTISEKSSSVFEYDRDSTYLSERSSERSFSKKKCKVIYYKSPMAESREEQYVKLGRFYRESREKIVIAPKSDSERSFPSVYSVKKSAVMTLSRGTSMEDIVYVPKRTSTTDLIKAVKAVGTNTRQVRTKESGIDPIPQERKSPHRLVETKTKFTNTESLKLRSTGTDAIPEKKKTLKDTGTNPRSEKPVHKANTGTDPIPYNRLSKSTNTVPIKEKNILKPITLTKGTQIITETKNKNTSYDKVETNEQGTDPIHSYPKSIVTERKSMEVIKRITPDVRYKKMFTSVSSENLPVLITEPKTQQIRAFSTQKGKCVQVINEKSPKTVRTLLEQQSKHPQTITVKDSKPIKFLTEQDKGQVQQVIESPERYIRKLRNQSEDNVLIISSQRPQTARTFRDQNEDYGQTLSSPHPHGAQAIDRPPHLYEAQAIDRAPHPHGAQAFDRAPHPHGAQAFDRTPHPQRAQAIDRAPHPHGAQAIARTTENHGVTISSKHPQVARTFKDQGEDYAHVITSSHPQAARTFNDQDEGYGHTVSHLPFETVRIFKDQREDYGQTVSSQHPHMTLTFDHQIKHCTHKADEQKKENVRVFSKQSPKLAQTTTKKDPQNIRTFVDQSEGTTKLMTKGKSHRGKAIFLPQKMYEPSTLKHISISPREQYEKAPSGSVSELSVELTIEKLHEEIFRRICSSCKSAEPCACKRRCDERNMMVCEKKKSNTIRISNKSDCEMKESENECEDVEFEINLNIKNSATQLNENKTGKNDNLKGSLECMETDNFKFNRMICNECPKMLHQYAVDDCNCDTEKSITELEELSEMTISGPCGWKVVAEKMKTSPDCS